MQKYKLCTWSKEKLTKKFKTHLKVRHKLKAYCKTFLKIFIIRNKKCLSKNMNEKFGCKERAFLGNFNKNWVAGTDWKKYFLNQIVKLFQKGKTQLKTYNKRFFLKSIINPKKCLAKQMTKKFGCKHDAFLG